MKLDYLNLKLGVNFTQKHNENVATNLNNFNGHTEYDYAAPFEISSCCWVCEGWAETKFSVSVSKFKK